MSALIRWQRPQWVSAECNKSELPHGQYEYSAPATIGQDMVPGQKAFKPTTQPGASVLGLRVSAFWSKPRYRRAITVQKYRPAHTCCLRPIIFRTSLPTTRVASDRYRTTLEVAPRTYGHANQVNYTRLYAVIISAFRWRASSRSLTDVRNWDKLTGRYKSAYDAYDGCFVQRT